MGEYKKMQETKLLLNNKNTKLTVSNIRVMKFNDKLDLICGSIRSCRETKTITVDGETITRLGRNSGSKLKTYYITGETKCRKQTIQFRKKNITILKIQRLNSQKLALTNDSYWAAWCREEITVVADGDNFAIFEILMKKKVSSYTDFSDWEMAHAGKK